MMLYIEQMHKMVEVVILSENSWHFVSRSACNNSYFLLSLRKVMCSMVQLPMFNTENEDHGMKSQILELSAYYMHLCSDI